MSGQALNSMECLTHFDLFAFRNLNMLHTHCILHATNRIGFVKAFARSTRMVSQERPSRRESVHLQFDDQESRNSQVVGTSCVAVTDFGEEGEACMTCEACRLEGFGTPVRQNRLTTTS